MSPTTTPSEEWVCVRDCRCGCVVVVVKLPHERILRHLVRCGKKAKCDHAPVEERQP